MKNIREEIERREESFLSPFSALSSKSQGRKNPESPDSIRTDFQRDRDRIIHCKAFRRLKHKTQVFISPAEDHYRTRLTHTLEVSQIARTLARALNLNEDLTEAIALGHDLGHTPFGHAGEEALDNLLQKNFGERFFHNFQSIRVVEVLEKDGRGLNLTAEVLDGIKNHPTHEPWPKTLEGKLVRYSDRFAYLRHDIEDAINAKVLKKDDLPQKHMAVLGENILDTFTMDLIRCSIDKPDIKMSDEIITAMNGLYDFMYQNVYFNPFAKREENKIPYMIHQLFLYYHYNKDFQQSETDQLQHTVDFIAGMTDRFAINKFMDLFVPREWRPA
ncbi:MAG: dGTPase [Candidatus Saganbacteria bacterium]|uniref:dGTPase n=1 Tax=Candidatus Saganbacteria bacterium TaxID=2575572 RepID=A0A833L1V6_UNCSA|nr:MAG: dGTPase [Candidatus Saganbacteria bacterium]